MKLLLINPRFPESFWTYKWAVDNLLPKARTLNPPLGLATLAALCPDNWEVEIVDENVESIPLEPDADIVGVCGMGVQFERQKELLAYYRSRGHTVVAGGSYASLCPERYTSLADTVVAGEAEYVWKEFCRDTDAGVSRALYRETGSVDLNDSPTPRFDLLKTEKYDAMSIQFSRGCPYRCEFCDIIVMFGRRPRTKSLPQIGAELDALRRQGARNVFFVDDNLIGDKKAAKRLLAFLASYQKDHDYRFNFGTEMSLNVAGEPELLKLLRAANFAWVFIGIESPEKGSLEETGKYQNTRGDMLTSVRTIYAHGIDVLAGFIVGFDNDTVSTFERQYQFIVDSGIQSAMIGLLTALEKTPLYERLKKENRLMADVMAADNFKLLTNVIPKGMSYEELIEGYRTLHSRLLEPRAIADRVRNKMKYFNGPSRYEAYSLSESLEMFGKIACGIAAQSGARALYHFARSLPFTKPTLIPLAVRDWALGVSMRDYAARHFEPTVDSERRAARDHLGQIRRALQGYLRQGSLTVALHETENGGSRFLMSLRGKLGRDFFLRASDQIDRMLRDTKSSLILRIDEFNIAELQALRNMLDRLKQHGDRIVIAADRKSRLIIGIDSSVFHLVME